MEVESHSFSTKTGICVITPDRILLERQGNRGKAAGAIFGKSIGRALTIYGMFGILGIMTGVWMLSHDNIAMGGFLVVIGLALLLNIFYSRNDSAALAIKRSDVRSIESHSPRPPFTRGYFSVRFIENGKEHRRLIMLPGSLSNGKGEFEKALKAMRESGLMK